MVLDEPPHALLRPRNSFWSRVRQGCWGESTVYAFIFFTGLAFFLIQLWTWLIPQLAIWQEFVESRAVVLESRIVEKAKEGGAVYRPEVLIEYQVDGQKNHREWVFDDRTFLLKNGNRDYAKLIFSSDPNIAKAALEPFSTGREIRCWYRAGQPDQAIVLWNTWLWGWFFLVLSLSLTILGLVGFLLSFRLKTLSEERRRATASGAAFQSPAVSARKNDWPGIPDSRIINESPGTHLAFRLPLGNQPLFPLVGLTLFALAWFVIACAINFHSFLNPAESWSDQVVGTAMRGLFWGVGIVLLAWVIHRLFLIFGMGPTLLEISDHPIYPGRRYRMLIHQSGVLRFRSLVVDVVCEELARFRQGTDTVTNSKDVFRQNLFEQNDFETSTGVPLDREFFLQLPIGAMHSFRQENNEIAWKIEIDAKIVGWPDIHRECPIVVRPGTWNDTIQEGVGL